MKQFHYPEEAMSTNIETSTESFDTQQNPKGVNTDNLNVYHFVHQRESIFLLKTEGLWDKILALSELIL